MKFFIDTADLKEIEEALSLGILDGVTTNPSLMAKTGVKGKDNIMRRYRAIAELVPGDVSAEVIAVDFDGMIKEAYELAEIADNIVVKIPMTKDGLRAVHYLETHGIRTNCTLVFSPGQALLAAKAGATYVSPFIGRLDDISSEGMQLIADIRLIFDNYRFDTRILAASIRHPMHIVESARIGADVVTTPLKPLLSLLRHPLTDIGLEKFLADYRKATGDNN